ncbi:MAG: hypothetical protein KJ630_18400 [Proteobacteria bacterium]|nr:hypothetical protein [Pseudomonadota bacterium]
MLQSRRPLFQAGYYFATIVLLTLLVFFAALEKPLNTIIIRPHLDAEDGDILTIYLPKANGAYRENKSSAIKFPKGQSTPELVISAYPTKQPLRLDPLIGKGRVVLLDLTFERFGITKKLEAKDLAALLIKSVDVKWQLSEKGLEITSNSIDPQLYFQFQELPIPLPPVIKILPFLLFFLVNLCALLFCARKWLQSPPHSIRFTLAIGPLVLVLLCWAFQWSSLLTITACTLFAATLLHTVAAVVVSGRIRLSLSGPNIQALLTTSCFLLLVIYPFTRTLYPDRNFIDASRQLMADFTGNSLKEWHESSINLVKGIENNLIQCFSLRTELIHLNANIKMFGFGFSATPKAILGKNGMFFEGYGEQRVERDITAHFDNVTDYMGLIPYTDKELEAWRICLEERYYWLKEKGIDYIFTLAPSKAQVYPENLPAKILETKEALNLPTRYDQLIAHLKLHSSVPVVDLASALHQAKLRAEEQNTLASTPLYYRTDFHWTYYGAYIAYRAIIDEVNRKYPQYQISPTPIEDFSIKTRPDWVHAPFINLLGLDPVRHRNEPYLTFHPRPGTPLADVGEFATKGINDYSLPEPIYETFNGNVVGTRDLINKSGKIDTIFVIGDSFSEKFLGFFSAHAKKTINFRTVYSFYSEPFEKHLPNLVIQEVLNMYLLQPPPTNTEQVQQARVRALSRKSIPTDSNKS